MGKLLIGILALAMLVGCNDAKKTRGTANGRGTRSQTGTNDGNKATLQALNCAGSADTWGIIYDDRNNQQMWQANTVLFGAASVNYADIGTVSGLENSTTEGIAFCGRICQNTNNANFNEVYIGIWDSKFISGEFDSEISVNIKHNGMYGGRLESSTPNSSAKFIDKFGSVEFVGGSTNSSGRIEGEFWFTNFELVAGPQELMNRRNERVRLGRFKIKPNYFWQSGC